VLTKGRNFRGREKRGKETNFFVLAPEHQKSRTRPPDYSGKKKGGKTDQLKEGPFPRLEKEKRLTEKKTQHTEDERETGKRGTKNRTNTGRITPRWRKSERGTEEPKWSNEIGYKKRGTQGQFLLSEKIKKKLGVWEKKQSRNILTN